MRHQQPEQWHINYAARHRGEFIAGMFITDSYDVMQDEKLSLASWCEYRIGLKSTTVEEARREFVNVYPEHNVTVSGRYIQDAAMRTKFNPNPSSILEMIRPYADSLRRIININSE